jgi:hypothetical protein
MHMRAYLYPGPMNRIVYKATPNWQFFISLLLRGACLPGLAYLSFHFEENHLAIIIAGFIVTFLFMVTGNDEITLFEDRIVQTNTSILSLIVRSCQRLYSLQDIESVSLPVKEKLKLGEVGLAVLLSALSQRQNTVLLKNKRIYLDFRNKKSTAIFTNLEDSKIQKIVDLVNDLVKTA